MTHEADTNHQSELPRRLGAFALGALTIGIIVGSGIFRTPSTIAGLVNSTSLVIAVWILGGLITTCLALCLAELGAMFPQTGGLYIYLEKAFGRRVAFLFGWTFLFISPANLAAIALIMASYTGHLAGLSAHEQKIVATVAIILVCVINILSVKLASRFNILFTAAKAGALLGIAGIVFWLKNSSMEHAISQPSHVTGFHMGLFGLALVAVLWPYEGVSASTSMAGEVKNPHRNLPRGLVGGVIGVTLLYVIVNVAFLATLSVERMASSNFVAADAMQAVTGDLGGAIIAVCAIIATIGAMLASATCDPRVFFAMARDRMFFSVVGKIHPAWKTPYIAIIVSGTLSTAYVWIRSFEQLATQFVLGMWIFYTLTVIGLVRLRFSMPDLVRPYRVPFFPVLPFIFIIAAAGLLFSAFSEMPLVSLIDLGIVAAGLPVYELWLRRTRNQILPSGTNE